MIYIYIHTYIHCAASARHGAVAGCRCSFIRVWKKKETGRCLWLEWVYPPKHERIEKSTGPILFFWGPPHLHPLRGGSHAPHRSLGFDRQTESARPDTQTGCTWKIESWQRTAGPPRRPAPDARSAGPRHKERRAPRAPGLDTNSAARGPPTDRHRKRQGPTHRLPGPDKESRGRGVPGPDTQSAGPRHKEGVPGPDTKPVLDTNQRTRTQSAGSPTQRALGPDTARRARQKERWPAVAAAVQY